MMTNDSIMNAHSPAPETIEDRHARRRERTRQAILEAARMVMGRSGAVAATIADITRQADVGVGTFYLHFRDKDEVTRTILTQGMEHLHATIASQVRDIPLERSLTATIRATCDATYANRDLFSIAYSNGMLIAFALDARERLATFLTSTLEEARTLGLIEADQDVGLLAGLITGMIDHSVLQWLEHTIPDPQRVAEQIICLLRGGLPTALLAD